MNKTNQPDHSELPAIAVLSAAGFSTAAALAVSNVGNGAGWALFAEGLISALFLSNLASLCYVDRTQTTYPLHSLIVLAGAIGLITVQSLLFTPTTLYWTLIVPVLAFSLLDLSLGALVSAVAVILLLLIHIEFRSHLTAGEPGPHFIAVQAALSVILFYNKLATARNKQRLAYAAETDPLTGAYNRSKLKRLLHHETARSERYGSQIALLMFDLDRFKEVNDRYGHAVGDHVLCEVVDTIRNNIRASDTLFRIGGDEFVVLALGMDKHAAEVLARKLRRLVSQSRFSNVGSVSISVGVATRDISETGAALLTRVDKALYAAKRNGRNRCSQAHPRSEQRFELVLEP